MVADASSVAAESLQRRVTRNLWPHSVANDPVRTLPTRAFEWNHRELDEIDQDLLEYLYSGAAFS